MFASVSSIRDISIQLILREALLRTPMKAFLRCQTRVAFVRKHSRETWEISTWHSKINFCQVAARTQLENHSSTEYRATSQSHVSILAFSYESQSSEHDENLFSSKSRLRNVIISHNFQQSLVGAFFLPCLVSSSAAVQCQVHKFHYIWNITKTYLSVKFSSHSIPQKERAKLKFHSSLDHLMAMLQVTLWIHIAEHLTLGSSL